MALATSLFFFFFAYVCDMKIFDQMHKKCKIIWQIKKDFGNKRSTKSYIVLQSAGSHYGIQV